MLVVFLINPSTLRIGDENKFYYWSESKDGFPKVWSYSKNGQSMVAMVPKCEMEWRDTLEASMLRRYVFILMLLVWIFYLENLTTPQLQIKILNYGLGLFN